MTPTNVFSAVADPTRRAMLDLLASKPRSAGEIVSRFPNITQPGVSRHPRVLREAQLVSVRVQAQQRIYSLKPEGLRELQAWVGKYQAFWADKMDALEQHLDSKTSKQKMGK
ncbi:MAG TPA: metalloregulator ArsR/SmtB family transcription factor [Nitrososphaerales archaeon]|nr:metalloregulator ArsR/SmtB family transcription factor [Nitrososphaerales archaeon]